MDFYNSVFPGEVKMCLGFMSFRALSAALKQKNYHNSPNMSPIITYFRWYLSSWDVIFWLSFQNNWTCFIFVIGMLHFSRFFIFNKFPATYAFHMCVEYDKTMKTPSNKIWYGIYIRQILYKNTCICVPFKCEKTRVWIIASLTLKVTSWRYLINGIYRPSL